MNKLTTRLMAAVMCAVAALMVAMPTRAVAADEDVLVVAQRQDPKNWDPIDTYRVAWGSVASNFYDGLVRRDENLKLQPGLATDWEVLDDGMRIRFHLRKGVTFHNGEPFNAKAVKYTFDRLLGEVGAQGPQRANYTTIDHVEIIDEYTVDFHMKVPDPVMLTKLSGYGAMIVPPQYIENKGQTYFDLHPVGTGPFKVIEYVQGSHITMVPNTDYFGQVPQVDKLIYRFIKEDATRLAEFQAGNVDIIVSPPFAMLPTFKTVPDAQIISVPGPAIQSLSLRPVDAATSDVRVRRALNMAVNKQALINAFLGGHGEPIASLQGRLSFGYDPELEGYPYDPERARELLKAAGVEPGTKMTIDYRAGNSTFNEVVQALSGFFGAVGIDIELRPLEDAVFINEVVPQGRTSEMYQFGWGGWTFDFDNTAYLRYHSGTFRNPYIENEKLDKLLERQRTMTDTAKREKLLQKIARLVKKKAYDIPLYSRDQVYVLSGRVQEFKPAPDKRLRLNSVSLSH